MAPPPMVESVLQLGFRFEPTAKDAVTYYLPRLIAGEPMHGSIRPFIHAADIYACEPGVLAAQFRPTPRTGDRFFFTTCKLQPVKAGKSSRAVRAAGPCGSWHSQGNSTDVKNAMGAKIGEVKKLRYKKGGVFTDWLMDEYSSFLEGSFAGDRQYVLCKIYVSPRAAPDSAARQESDAFVFAPLDEPVAAATSKRPAPPVAEPPCPKKTRIAAAPALPVVQPPLPSSTSTPVPARPVAPPARRMAVQELSLHRHPSPPPSIQASTAAPAPCSPIAARDPFCTEPPAPASAQEDNGDDLVGLIESNFETTEEEAGEEEASEAEQAEEEAAADADDWFAPMMSRACKETDPFAAATAPQRNWMMPIF